MHVHKTVLEAITVTNVPPIYVGTPQPFIAYLQIGCQKLYRSDSWYSWTQPLSYILNNDNTSYLQNHLLYKKVCPFAIIIISIAEMHVHKTVLEASKVTNVPSNYIAVIHDIHGLVAKQYDNQQKVSRLRLYQMMELK